MVHFSDIESLRASLQFLAFSEAYLESAARLCKVAASSPAESSYPKGAVVLNLTFHGVELFLKAAILEKVPSEQLAGSLRHDLDRLHKRYTNLYPAKMYAFEIPFRYEEVNLVDPDPRIIEELRIWMTEHKRTTPADQVHRYPETRAEASGK